MKEIFVPIKDYEGLYEISNLGRVKSCPREWVSGNGLVRRKGETMLSLSSNYNYLFVGLSKKGKRKARLIHLLVWDHFGTGERNQHILEVDHIDDDPFNNRIDNLQLLSARDNAIKKYKKIKTTNILTGACWSKQNKKWASSIFFNKKRRFLGYYDTEHEAHSKYMKFYKQNCT